MVDRIAASGEVRSPRVLSALRSVPRHAFVPSEPIARVYVDSPLPIGFGQTISAPGVVALMTEALELRGDERVLEIGTGSGYQAAILSRLAREVHTIERIDALAETAAARLRDVGYDNVVVHAGDGYVGLADKAPFDRILLAAAPPEIPPVLFDQLSDGGILVAPVGERRARVQELVRFRKVKGKLERETLAGVRFLPMVPGERHIDRQGR
jgi:protein-L-isoaspartate(D-aspartate) O-methyltransferase